MTTESVCAGRHREYIERQLPPLLLCVFKWEVNLHSSLSTGKVR